MAKSNLKTQVTRKRELAKKDSRGAKDQKRALRKTGGRTARTVAAVSPATVSRQAALQRVSVARAPTAIKPKPLSVAASAFIRSMNIQGS